VLVAFVLFRLSHVGELVRHAQAVLATFNAPVDRMWPILRDGGPAAIEAEMKRQPTGSTRLTPGTKQWGDCETAYAAWQERSRALPRIYAALFATAIDIALCFIALPFTPVIAGSRLAAWMILGVASGLGVVCVALYVWLIAGIVGRPSE
jgi:hypothetical protein